MTTGYLLTCGTSLLGNLASPDRDEPVGARLIEALDGVESRLRAAIHPRPDRFTYEPTLAGVLDDFRGLRGIALPLAGGDPEHELRPLGAELESLVRRMRGQGPEGSRPLRVDDPIALIVSDTPQGVTAGLLIAAMMGRAIRVLRHSGTPEETINGWEVELAEAGPGADPDGAPIDVYVIPGLATGSEGAISAAAPWLAGALARTVGRVLKNEHWSVVERSEAEISGGFKATLPLVHALLEYCAPIARVPISCVLRHESAPDVWIRVGLRQLTRKELAMRLQEVREVRDGAVPEAQMMRGFAWRMSDSPTGPRIELTPEGWGILAFPPPS
jgi:hypothetical protein